MKIIVAVTGASGIQLAKRLLAELEGHSVELILSEGALDVAKYEEVAIEDLKKHAENVYSDKELDSPLASSSNLYDAMVCIPTSMKTLSSIANGYADNLVSRAAENMLKLGRKLVIVPRETPISLSAIENMRKLKLANAIILPPNIGYYFKPKTLEDVEDFIVGKVLDCIEIDHRLYSRWKSGKNIA